MIKTELTFKQVRMAKEFYLDAIRYAENHNQLEIEKSMSWNNDIRKLGGKYYFVKFFEGLWYYYILENHTTSNTFTISNGDYDEEYNIEDIESILGDIEDEAKFFVELDISPIEKYIEKLVGVPVTLKKQYITFPEVSMNLFSENLVEYTGICKAMLKEIHISCKNIHFSIDRETGKQFLSISSIAFRYEHSQGGNNGYDIGRVHYNLETKEWTGFNYELDKFEVL